MIFVVFCSIAGSKNGTDNSAHRIQQTMRRREQAYTLVSHIEDLAILAYSAISPYVPAGG